MAKQEELQAIHLRAHEIQDQVADLIEDEELTDEEKQARWDELNAEYQPLKQASHEMLEQAVEDGEMVRHPNGGYRWTGQ